MTKCFGTVTAVNSLDLEVAEGEALGIYGPNGAGKTTLINLITGLVKPDSGSVRFRGAELLGLKPHQIVQRGVARTFQLSRPFLGLTVHQNILVASYSQSRRAVDSPEEFAEKMLSTCGLYEKSKRKASTLSQGELRRLEIARALAANPRLFLLDEPFSALSPKDEDEILSVLKDFHAKGLSMIVVSHSPRVLSELADRVVFMREGRIVGENTSPQVLPNASLWRRL